MSESLTIFIIASGMALVLAPAAGFVGARLGFVDAPVPDGTLKIHARAVPVVGGVVTVTAVFVSLVVLDVSIPAGIFVGTCLALCAGLVDDVRPLTVWLRLFLLAVAGVVVSIPLLTEWGVIAALGIVALTICAANGVNILDGQDCLAGGLVVSAALGLALALPPDELETSLLGLGLAGAGVGFLVWNRPPARLFLGNNGAYSLGVLLAVLCAVLIEARGWRGVAAGGTCLAVVALEVVSTLLRRGKTRRSLTGGDRSHSYDLLAERFGSREKATLVFIGIGVLSSAFGLLIAYAPPIAAATVFVCAFGTWAAAVGVLWRQG